jgi:hypothetical protein
MVVFVAVNLRRAGVPRLGEALRAYRAKYDGKLDAGASRVLRHLEASTTARKAFKGFDWLKESGDAVAIVEACVEAERLARTFAERIERERRKLRQNPRLREATELSRDFVNELVKEQKQPSDPLRVRETVPPDEIEAMGRGLALLEMHIGTGERVAKMNLFRLHVMHKSKGEGADKGKDAGPIAAIKWLANRVKEIKKRATSNLRIGNENVAQIANLAQVILGGDVSDGQVRAGLRARDHWKWLQ